MFYTFLHTTVVMSKPWGGLCQIFLPSQRSCTLQMLGSWDYSSRNLYKQLRYWTCNSTSVKKFWHEAQETNQGRRDRFYTEIVIRLSRWSRRLLLQNLHSEHDNLCITPHLMKLLMNWFCYIQFHCGVNKDCFIKKVSLCAVFGNLFFDCTMLFTIILSVNTEGVGN